jgi:hypothetical protein
MKRVWSLVAIAVLAAGTLAAGPAAGPTGTLRIESQGLVLKVEGPPNKATQKPTEVMLPFGRDLTLPVGDLKVMGLNLVAQDAQKEVWSLESAGALGKLARVSVAEGQTTAVEGGGPVRVKTRVVIEKGAPPGSKVLKPTTVTVLLNYVGQAGEVYGPKVMRGNRQGPRPVIRLVDYDGKALAQGDYTYPCSTGGG